MVAVAKRECINCGRTRNIEICDTCEQPYCDWHVGASITGPEESCKEQHPCKLICRRCEHEFEDEEYETWCQPEVSHDYGNGAAR